MMPIANIHRASLRLIRGALLLLGFSFLAPLSAFETRNYLF
jgi:hypothetical protein